MAHQTSIDPFMSKGFEPLGFECERPDLPIEGRVPVGLDGTFYRIGPNPQFSPRGTYNPLDGDGMVHAFRIHEGRVSYRNRWVRTQRWSLENAAGRALFGTSGNPADSDPSVVGMQTDGVANTNIVRHANRLLALEEGHAPIEMDSASLATIGTWTYNNQLPRNMTAHPKIDPRTGELLFFANVPNGRLTGELDYYLANAAGDLIRSQRFQGPFPALVHDFAVTPDFVVFGICPVTLSLSRARAGGPLIAWEPDRGTHVGIIPRRGGASDFQWFAGPSCMVWHFMNAFNEGNRIVVDGCQQKSAMFPAADGSPPDSDRASQYLTRWEFDWTKPGNFRIDRLSEVRCEYPRIDERRTGLSYRHGYVAFIGGPGSADLFHRGLGHFDHANQTMQIYDAGPRCAVAEPVFVPRASGSPEGEGYLLTNVFDEDRNASHLAIFDAEQVESGPIARAHLGHRVPVGFHANWSPR